MELDVLRNQHSARQPIKCSEIQKLDHLPCHHDFQLMTADHQRTQDCSVPHLVEAVAPWIYLYSQPQEASHQQTIQDQHTVRQIFPLQVGNWDCTHRDRAIPLPQPRPMRKTSPRRHKRQISPIFTSKPLNLTIRTSRLLLITYSNSVSIEYRVSWCTITGTLKHVTRTFSPAPATRQTTRPHALLGCRCGFPGHFDVYM
jgi:hypothetical protein